MEKFPFSYWMPFWKAIDFNAFSVKREQQSYEVLALDGSTLAAAIYFSAFPCFLSVLDDRARTALE